MVAAGEREGSRNSYRPGCLHLSVREGVPHWTFMSSDEGSCYALFDRHHDMLVLAQKVPMNNASLF